MEKNKSHKKKSRTTAKVTTVPNTPPVLAEIGVPLKDFVSDKMNDMKQSMSKSTTDKLSRLRKDLTKLDVKYYLEPIDGEEPEEYEARIPHPAHDGDIGMDIVATEVEYDACYDRYIYHTGFYAESLRGTGCKIMPRSSNSKTDAYLCNGVGLVDVFTYRGEFCIMFKNRDSLATLASLDSMRRWNNMSWYEKLFRSYDMFEHRIYKEYLDRALELAPYEVGDHVGQLVWEKFPEVNLIPLASKDELSKTERGEGGFGSTGR